MLCFILGFFQIKSQENVVCICSESYLSEDFVEPHLISRGMDLKDMVFLEWIYQGQEYCSLFNWNMICCSCFSLLNFQRMLGCESQKVF